MFRRKNEIDTKLLLHAIQRTANFESLLSRRFEGVTLQQYEETRRQAEQGEAKNPFEEAIDDPSNPFFVGDKDETKPAEDALPVDGLNPFSGIISSCFEPHLSIYVEAQDKNLSDLVDRAASEQRARGCANLAAEGSAVLHSCGDLFMFYKKCLVQCAQLSANNNGEALLSLAAVFKKYLREYASKVLIANLPKSASSANTVSAAATSMKDLSLIHI